jgi:tetratricopeptide (TPR) repeat protein
MINSILVIGQTKYEKADTLYHLHKYKDALKEIEADISERGFLEDNAVLKTKILMYVDGDKCFETIQAAISAFPNSAMVYHERALIYFEMRDFVNSVIDDTKALELCQNDSLKFDILLSRSSVYHYMGQIENAITDCRKTLELKPDNIYILNNLSTILFDQGESVESEKLLLKIKEINPKFMGAYINLGYQKLQLGKYEEAEKYLQEGIKVNSEDAFLLNNLGYIQHKLGRSKEGISNINKSIKLVPKNSYCYRNLALIYFDMNEKDKACENAQKALRLHFSDMYGTEMKEFTEKHCL